MSVLGRRIIKCGSGAATQSFRKGLQDDVLTFTISIRSSYMQGVIVGLRSCPQFESYNAFQIQTQICMWRNRHERSFRLRSSSSLALSSVLSRASVGCLTCGKSRPWNWDWSYYYYAFRITIWILPELIKMFGKSSICEVWWRVKELKWRQKTWTAYLQRGESRMLVREWTFLNGFQ